MKFKLKEGLLLGSATAATQIEGGDGNVEYLVLLCQAENTSKKPLTAQALPASLFEA